MNYLKTIFFGAFIVCAILLGIVFFVGQRHATQENKPILFQENINQLKELGRTKYQQSLRYLAYAHHAERDSMLDVALLFHALSHADAIHNANCRHAIEALGGRYSHPIISPTQFTSTTSHLEKTLHNKSATHCNLMPHYIGQALSDNNRYVARMLTWCDASDVKQIILLQEMLEVSAPRHKHVYKVCPTCGDITWEDIATRHCPMCMTDSALFKIITPTHTQKLSAKEPRSE